MRCLRCDRCGAVYDESNTNAKGTNFVMIADVAISPVQSPQKVVYMLEGVPVMPMDICPACAEDFKRWFGRGGMGVFEK